MNTLMTPIFEGSFTATVLDSDTMDLKREVVERLFGFDIIAKEAGFDISMPDGPITDEQSDDLDRATMTLYEKIRDFLTITKGNRICYRDGEGNPNGDYEEDYTISYKFQLIKSVD